MAYLGLLKASNRPSNSILVLTNRGLCPVRALEVLVARPGKQVPTGFSLQAAYRRSFPSRPWG